MKVLVCGGRDIADAELVESTLNRLLASRGPFERLIHGGARGVDRLAGTWARKHGVLEWDFLPEWHRAGKHDAAPCAISARLPADDARFVALFAHALEHTGGYTPEEATRVAGTQLPDLLRYNPTRPASFPGNGRALTDDVADFFLAILTNGKVTGDKVGPHGDLIPEFPYLGPPHNSR